MIAIGCDHAAYSFKAKIIEHLKSKGYDVLDVGTYDPSQSSDYPDFALKVAESVAGGQADKGIVICGTGIGVSITANKVKGIRCALCSDTFSAHATREHNNANMLALGERTIGLGLALDIVDTFLNSEFTGEERHARRLAKVQAVEDKYFK